MSHINFTGGTTCLYLLLHSATPACSSGTSSSVASQAAPWLITGRWFFSTSSSPQCPLFSLEPLIKMFLQKHSYVCPSCTRMDKTQRYAMIAKQLLDNTKVHRFFGSGMREEFRLTWNVETTGAQPSDSPVVNSTPWELSPHMPLDKFNMTHKFNMTNSKVKMAKNKCFVRRKDFWPNL